MPIKIASRGKNMNKKENRNQGYVKIKRRIIFSAFITSLLVMGMYSAGDDIDIPPFPYYITGSAYYDGAVPADGALVTVTNERTLEELYDTVGPSGNGGTSGWFLVDLATSTIGYQDGDNITVVIYGCCAHSMWAGTNSTTVDTTTASRIVNIVLEYDPIPPVTTKHVGEPKYGEDDEYVTSNTEITFTATDTLTGVNKTYYRIWYNGNWDPSPGTGEGIDNNFYIYIGDFNLSGECKHYIEFYSTDNAGNNEAVQNQTHRVDETPPTTTHSLNPSSPSGLNGWYNSSTGLNITLSSTDDKSGVQTIYYKYADGGYQTYTEPITPPNGDHTLYYYSIDNLENIETPAKTASFKVDTTPPTVNIVSGPSGTISYFDVTFEWSGSDNIGGVEYQYKLDGTWSGWTSDTSHEFTGLTEDDYTFSVKVRDGAGNTNTATRIFTISKNKPPVADADGPYTGYVGSAITFDGSGSYDPDGSIVSYSWNFGDGHTDTGKKPTHIYTGQGTFPVTLTVTDNLGATDTDTTTATISPNQPPEADFSYTPASPTDLDVISFTDTSTDADGEIVNWTWHLGDGNISYEQNPTHKYLDNGTYTVKLTVKDDEGATDTKEEKIIVSNVKPKAAFTHDPDKPEVDEEITFTDASSDDDGVIVNWTWNFGDGNISYQQNPTHTYSQKDTYTVMLTVRDNDNATHSISLDIKITKEEVSYVLPILAVIILIIVAIIVVVIWRRRSST